MNEKYSFVFIKGKGWFENGKPYTYESFIKWRKELKAEVFL